MNKVNDRILLDELYAASKSSKPRRTRRSPKTIDTLTNLGTCPRSVDEVYSLGIKLQYYIGDIYLALNSIHQGEVKALYQELALKQLDAKDEIQKLANENLNKLLAYFYNNGGPIIESPVSEQMAKEMQPFYNRISANFLKQLDDWVIKASKQDMDADEVERTINNIFIEMYSTMSMLFPVEEVQDAFKELVILLRD